MNNVLNFMRRMGENVSNESVWGRIISHHPIVIEEGLIKSYDTDLVLSAICEEFHLSKNGEKEEPIIHKIRNIDYVFFGDAVKHKAENGEDTIEIILFKNHDLINSIKKRMNKYGWSLYEERKENNMVIFCFEKRYPFEMTIKQLLSYRDYVYHIAPVDLKNKILRQGLVPKESKTYCFSNEPRIYMWLNKPDKEKEKHMSFLRDKEKGMFTIKIDLNKMNPEHKIYVDPRMYNAFFSLEPISPYALTVENNV